MGIVWNEKDRRVKIIEMMLVDSSLNSVKKRYPEILIGRNKIIEKTIEDIKSSLCGRSVKFNIKILELSKLSGFQKKVLIFITKIPPGQTMTYGEVARKLGFPNAARAIGQALAKNPFPIIIPCHRVVKSNKNIGGFKGGVALKKKLLIIERRASLLHPL